MLVSWMEDSQPTGRLQMEEADRYAKELASFLERREEKARIAKEEEEAKANLAEKKLWGLLASEQLKEAVKEAGEMQEDREMTKDVGNETTEAKPASWRGKKTNTASNLASSWISNFR